VVEADELEEGGGSGQENEDEEDEHSEEVGQEDSAALADEAIEPVDVEVVHKKMDVEAGVRGNSLTSAPGEQATEKGRTFELTSSHIS